MIEKRIYQTKNKKQLVIRIPEKFRDKNKLLIVIDDSVDSRSEKMKLMRKASDDHLFKSDIEEISNDFKHSDREIQ